MTQPDSVDPTAIEIDFDPRSRRMSGIAFHGNTHFDVPYMSQVVGVENLWQGGCTTDPVPLLLPPHIKHLVSLYPWEQYEVDHDLDSRLEVRMYDSVNQAPDMKQVIQIATWVNTCRRQGPTLVHCQAGLNRSGLISATALILDGMDASTAIAALRSSRSNAVLCNPRFVSMLREFAASR